ncbi:hypothetical protein ONZ51_g12594 [Trametes cubensis]|uniref:N-acetyltransferase domain-containing protein n=1 Tax=Trametes cubensis TaxID=1111947 RepID=A0AAD7THZ8_9APHY|nr:hypothetical protein ONZ51_g12594 [Trametes cubensis]
MENPRCIRFANIEAAIEATAPYDDGFMNFCVGALHDHLRKSLEEEQFKNTEGYFFGVYRSDDLELILALHAAYDPTWRLLCPHSRQDFLTSAFLELAAGLLVDNLLEYVKPQAVSPIFGHKAAVDAFAMALIARVTTQGIDLNMERLVTTISSYATRDSIPPSLNTLSTHAIALATADDFEELVPLYLDFSTFVPGTRTREEDEARLRTVIASQLTWVCRVDGSIVAFVHLGRPSPKTIAVRNVYVLPAHRRKGIAEAIVGATTRYVLGVQPVGYEGAFVGPPAVGLKDFVYINAVDIAASRVYRRAGFLFPEQMADGEERGGIDPTSGKKGWIYSVLWSITKPSTEQTA